MADPRVNVKLALGVASDFEAAMQRFRDSFNAFARAVVDWHHPDNPYRDWPTCAYNHEVQFLGTEGGLTRPCPGCGAAL